MERFIYIVFIFCLISSAYPRIIFAGSAKEHVEKGNKHLIHDRAFAAIEEYKLAIEKGANDPVLFRNLSIILYDLGFLDEAAVYMEKALSISPYANSFQMELGIIYLVQEHYEKARKQFMAVLMRNPGFSNAYYYLGETFYRTEDYDMAWMFARTARQLRHKGSTLINNLDKVSTPPDIEPWNIRGESLLIRQILVDTKSRADEIAHRIASGELFEDVASEIDRTLNSVGGFLGHFKKSELHPKILKALSGRKVFSDPVIVETELGFHIVQRIVQFDFDQWKQMLADHKKTGETGRTVAKTTVKEKGPDEYSSFKESKISRNVTLVSNSASIPSKPDHPHKTESGEKNKAKKYLLFSGAFADKKNADERVGKLRKLGHPGYIHMQQSKKGPVHAVIAGKFDSFQKAREAGEDIAKHGLDYFISR